VCVFDFDYEVKVNKCPGGKKYLNKKRNKI
jgi:hypothetical protein